MFCESCNDKACDSCSVKHKCEHYNGENKNKKPVTFNGWVVGYKTIDPSLRHGE